MFLVLSFEYILFVAQLNNLMLEATNHPVERFTTQQPTNPTDRDLGSQVDRCF